MTRQAAELKRGTSEAVAQHNIGVLIAAGFTRIQAERLASGIAEKSARRKSKREKEQETT